MANYTGQQDFLYNNNGTSFDRVDTTIGLTDSSDGNGVAWGDYDNDGDLDLFVANYSSTQQDFLYNNNGTNFDRVDTTIGLTDSSDGAGVAWGDYDNDGDLDLFVANWGQQDFLYNNNGTSFDRVDTTIGLTDSSDGYGVAWGDYDNDGDLDLFVANSTIQQDFLYRNDCAAKSYIVIRPVIKNSNNTYRDAIGARVYVDLDGNSDFVFPGTIMQEVGGGSSLGQNQLWLQFGLGDILNDVAVKIIFPGPGTLEQRTVIYPVVHINQRVELRQNEAICSEGNCIVNLGWDWTGWIYQRSSEDGELDYFETASIAQDEMTGTVGIVGFRKYGHGSSYGYAEKTFDITASGLRIWFYQSPSSVSDKGYARIYLNGEIIYEMTESEFSGRWEYIDVPFNNTLNNFTLRIGKWHYNSNHVSFYVSCGNLSFY